MAFPALKRWFDEKSRLLEIVYTILRWCLLYITMGFQCVIRCFQLVLERMFLFAVYRDKILIFYSH